MSDENRFFEGIEFPELEEAKAPEPVDTTDPLASHDFTNLLTEVRRMIVAVESGQSLIARATSLKGAPIHKAIESLEQSPSLIAFIHFLKIAEQDVNLRFRRECVKLFEGDEKVKTVMEEKNVN